MITLIGLSCLIAMKAPEANANQKGKINMKLQNLIHILIGIVCIGLFPNAQALSQAPDGGYPGGNTAEGQNALFSLTTGGYNTGVGFLSLRSNTTTSFNTAIGAGTLLANTADGNTATGAGALFSNSTGAANTAIGAFALFSNTTNGGSTATGYQALFKNTGFGNTADGYQALYSNTTGHENAANGGQALFSNTTGFANTANGIQALLNNTEGNSNTATGYQTLSGNTTGGFNTANGYRALFHNTTGSNNIAIGYLPLFSNSTGSFNTALGINAGGNVTTANSVIAIGTPGANVSDSCFIGNIRGVTTANADAIPVMIDSAGQLGTYSSSRRFKKEIKPMGKASEAIVSLQPVTFHYKTDTTNTPQFGLIAEEVAAVNPDLVVRDEKGEIYTVRYDAVNAMLLNEFLKEHRKVERQEGKIQEQDCKVQEQAASIAALKSTVAQQRRDFETAIAQERKQSEATAVQQQKEIHVLIGSLNEQAVQIQKVSDKVAAASPSGGGLNVSKFATGRIRRGGTAPQIVRNNQ
jgi:hypothetical protein